MTRTRIAALALSALLAAGGCSSPEQETADPTAGVDVDLVYLNHPPVQPVLRDIDKVLAGYQEKISVTRYDADTPDGRKFADEHHLTGHVAIAILIDGEVAFKGFPAGAAPVQSAEGDWEIKDLDAALQQRTTNG
ncbi:hypothetical protein [Couchioplanes caeruleus]|uniref:Uncharacterized protein n=2 Tax=Couchioplanes caeruleus TaxID=56438 RepID=A0A1K0GMX0_9ACTN|nr:hypothetical protein [Couchioplanes caeruleus]OJF10547.1 hypothetical protein BG844_31530 [Couchioplanes caeruleus subsp. caeruleus]ROP28643.1 hypothetical protein EDD30_1410 [Couchioplanes caeruleus]